jgi:hypothetical protein
MVEKPPCADPDVEVARADVTLISLEQLGAPTSPHKAVREPEDEEVVDAQRERCVDALAGLDFVRSRLLVGHSQTLRWKATLYGTTAASLPQSMP